VSFDGDLALAGDIVVVPVADLPRATRDAIPVDAGDFAVSRVRSREPSHIVNGPSLALLQEFETPSRIVDAVTRYARKRGASAEQTFEAAFDMLSQFYRSRVLVAVNATDRETDPRLRRGETIAGFVLGHRVRDLEDTLVFFASDTTGRPAAVKVMKGGKGLVEHEASAMRRVGSRAPAVYAVAPWDDRGGVLVSEWVFGEEATRAAAMLRGRKGPRMEARLLALLVEIADAWSDLHHAGVLHGDVHPGNVLVEKGGRVRVLDLGLAVELKARAPVPVGRGGVAFYMDPELARASLRGEIAPLTAAGEQFSLGVLLYLLWTGVHYLDFSLERSTMLKQVIEREPVPFAKRKVPPWPVLEAILGRALAKDPRARFPSCGDLAAELRQLLDEAAERDRRTAVDDGVSRRAELDGSRAFFTRCGLGGTSLQSRPANAPYASLNYGAAGIAYAMYKIAIARDDARLLATADAWAEKAAVLAGRDEAFYAPEIDISEGTVGRASLFHSLTGIHHVRALVAFATGASTTANRALADFVTGSRAPCESDDLTTGTAGLLVGAAELLEAARGAQGCEAGDLLERGRELREGIAEVVGSNEFATSPEVSYLGLAHGWAGLLFALLRWSQAAGESAEPYRAKLDELLMLHEPHGLGVRWPTSNRTVARPAHMDGWCNGPAGHAQLWALAHELLGGEYGQTAERAAAAAWSSEMTLGTLCCGLAGVGYACVAAHRVTGDSVWLTRARIAGRRACEDRSSHSYADSLYKGMVGAVLLCEELEAGRAAMPLLEKAGHAP
jgi:eukaryotic-like serine/threonine-protein kinase